MDRFMGVEEARTQLGRLVEEIAQSGERVSLTKRGRPLATLVSNEEYARLKQAANRDAREDLGRRLAQIRRAVRSAGLDGSVVEEAIAAVRQLT
jgi:prevent-host-death family protein